MKSLSFSLCITLTAIFLLPVAPARAQSGILLKTFNVKAGKLLLDPARPRLYATLPLDNSLAVIDTDTNTVTNTLFIGSQPADLAMSPDGTRLYVANQGSTSAAIGVVDLTTLTTLASLPTPDAPSAIVAGNGNRLYVLTGTISTRYSIAQINAATGVVEATFGYDTHAGSYVRITPDGAKLFVAGYNGDTIYDVSTATPTALQTVLNSGGGGGLFAVSHDGRSLVGLGTSTTSSLVSTSNLGDILGSFNVGNYVGTAAFSVDDKLVYEVQNDGGSNGQSRFKIFSATTFTQLDSFPDPYPGATSGTAPTVTGLVATAPHGYLYVAAAGGFFGTNYLELLSTQRAPFFDGSVALADGFFYLKFADDVPFGYYSFNFSPYFYHSDLGFEFPFDAADGQGGIYLYDFTSSTFFYTSSSLFPFLYDFTLGTFLYYYPDPKNPGHYNTDGTRYFYDFATKTVISK